MYASSEGSWESGHLGSPETWLLDNVIIRDNHTVLVIAQRINPRDHLYKPNNLDIMVEV